MISLSRKSFTEPVAETTALVGPLSMLGFVILAILTGAVLAVLALVLGFGPWTAALAFPIGGWLTLFLAAVLIFRRGQPAPPTIQTSDNQKE